MKEGIIIVWRGKGFGEAIYASLFCHILVDNGVKAVFRDSASTINFLDVPMYDPREHGDWPWWKWGYKLNDVPIMQQNVDRASKWLDKDLIIKRDHIPVIFNEMDVPEVDVALNTKTSSYTPYKLWPYFDELKIKMAELGITYYDLDASETYGIECLNIVKKAKVYLGLDSGMAHYVSRFANGKTMILNGGFVTFSFWACLYDYEHIHVEDVPCRPCYLNYHSVENGRGCEYNNRCMGEITVDMVLNRICERLGK